MRRAFVLPIRVNAESFWRTHYTSRPTFPWCQFCDDLLIDIDAPSGVCDPCWYGMRLEPEKWERRLKRRGSPPPIYRGGCMWSGNTVACRNPFAPGLQAVEGG